MLAVGLPTVNLCRSTSGFIDIEAARTVDIEQECSHYFDIRLQSLKLYGRQTIRFRSYQGPQFFNVAHSTKYAFALSERKVPENAVRAIRPPASEGPLRSVVSGTPSKPWN